MMMFFIKIFCATIIEDSRELSSLIYRRNYEMSKQITFNLFSSITFNSIATFSINVKKYERRFSFPHDFYYINLNIFMVILFI